MTKSPTQLTLEHMREQGCKVHVVERWNHFARRREDLFGIVDVLCLSPDGITIGVQSTSRGNIAKRVAKITASENLAAIRRCGWRLLVHGWDKHERRYRLKEVDV